MISLVEWGKIIVLHVLHNVACLSSLILTRDKGMYGMYRTHRLYGTRKAGHNQTDHHYRAGSLWRGCHFGSKFANSPINLKRTNGPGWTNYYFKVRSNLPWEAFVTLLNCFTIPWNDAEFQIFKPWSSCECVAGSSEQFGPPFFDNSGAVKEAHAKKMKRRKVWSTEQH